MVTTGERGHGTEVSGLRQKQAQPELGQEIERSRARRRSVEAPLRRVERARSDGDFGDPKEAAVEGEALAGEAQHHDLRRLCESLARFPDRDAEAGIFSGAHTPSEADQRMAARQEVQYRDIVIG